MHQVGVGDEGLAKRHEVGMAAFDGGLGQRAVIAVVDHPCALAASGAVSVLELSVVERTIRNDARAAGGAFDHV
ncbi:hypothetical protein SDC9_104198 [bioreactor metagenome]|uniref:Uncharacterized protein n=1 Tax=bioreactor metagenome TaxID=1076179 RepID=A0A645AX58_9ZZZZ